MQATTIDDASQDALDQRTEQEHARGGRPLSTRREEEAQWAGANDSWGPREIGYWVRGRDRRRFGCGRLQPFEQRLEQAKDIRRRIDGRVGRLRDPQGCLWSG